MAWIRRRLSLPLITEEAKQQTQILQESDADEGIPDAFLCPITSIPMRNPHSLPCGHAFEKAAIEQWLERQISCPLCRTACGGKKLNVATQLRDAIEAYTARRFEDKLKANSNEAIAEEQWTEVELLLRKLNLSQYGTKLRQEGFDSINVLVAASPEDLQSGVGMKFGHAILLRDRLRQTSRMEAVALGENDEKRGVKGTLSVRGGVYTGELLHNKRHGQGEWVHLKNGRYLGGWRNDKRSGFGVYTYSDGGTFEGGWKEGHCEGPGVLTFADGSNYEGCFKKSQKHGPGSYNWPDGARYESYYWNGKEQGHGTMYYPDGGEYTGAWSASCSGKWEGQGVYVYPDGRKYEGEWKDGKKHGAGTFSSPDGRLRVGHWVNGRLNGLVVCIDRYGRSVDEQWSMGQIINTDDSQLIPDASEAVPMMTHAAQPKDNTGPNDTL
eukprot:gb/GEZN01005410.1/.p1 GENE.gb/GEZN01005410.1/~~gb/GEZN01005410.1/.p1  ORF type:complete len:439 (-),score=38.83 gb/GEZN01005410.1/:221-1537(-)